MWLRGHSQGLALICVLSAVAASFGPRPAAGTAVRQTQALDERADNAGDPREWVRLLGGKRSTSGGPIARASNGDILMAGTVRSRDASATDYRQWDVIVARFTSGGKLVWRVEMGGDGQDIPAGIGELRDGRVVVTTSSTSATFNGVAAHGGYDVATVVLSAGGLAQWTRLAGGKGDELASSMAVEDDRVFVGGFQIRPADTPCSNSDRGFVLAYHGSGRQLWNEGVKRETDLATTVLGVAAEDGVVTVVGSELRRCALGRTPQVSTGLIVRLTKRGARTSWSRVPSVVRLDAVGEMDGSLWALGTHVDADGRLAYTLKRLARDGREISSVDLAGSVPLGIGMGPQGPVVVGTTRGSPALGTQAWAAWFSHDGLKRHEAVLGGPGWDMARSVVATDGVTVVCGDTEQWPGGRPQTHRAAFLVAVPG